MLSISFSFPYCSKSKCALFPDIYHILSLVLRLTFVNTRFWGKALKKSRKRNYFMIFLIYCFLHRWSLKEKTWGNEVRLFTNVTIALWETDDWHGRHFAPARSASIVWEIVNIWHCQTTRTHFYPCEEKRQNSPPVSKKFLNYFLTKNNSHHLVKKIE